MDIIENGLNINCSDYKVLIVDDVNSNVLLLRVLLSSKKFQIFTASNGRLCLEAVKKESPDIILLDVMMPDMTGYEVAQTLRNDPEYEKWKETPIIFLTALNSSNDIITGFKSGGNDFVSKPFNKDELMIRLSHQLSLVKAKRIISEKNMALEATIKNRDKMYSVIAHDLRSPIGTVKMMLEMLQNVLPVETIGQEMHDLIVQISEQTDVTFALLDNLLKWTKSQTGRLNVVHQKFMAYEQLPSIVDVYAANAKLKNISLEYIEDPSDHVVLYADNDMTRTIVRNFISNALKFTSAGGYVKVFCSRKNDDFIAVNVKDNGCGISKEDQEKMFNTKTHFSKYGTNLEEGSGLGLLLCMDFAKKIGGDLFFESEEGKGSTFSFTIPVFKEGMDKSKNGDVQADK